MRVDGIVCNHFPVPSGHSLRGYRTCVRCGHVVWRRRMGPLADDWQVVPAWRVKWLLRWGRLPLVKEADDE